MKLLVPAVLFAVASCRGSPSPGPDAVFVSDESAGVVHVIDVRSGQVETELATGPRPRGLGSSPDGRTLYDPERLRRTR